MEKNESAGNGKTPNDLLLVDCSSDIIDYVTEKYKSVNTCTSDKILENVNEYTLCMVLDIEKTGMKGLKICLEVHKIFPKLPLIAYTESRSTETVNKMVNRFWPMVYVEKGQDPNTFLGLVDYLTICYRHYLFGTQYQKALRECSSALELILNKFGDDRFRLRDDALKNIKKEIFPYYQEMGKFVHEKQGKRLYEFIKGKFVTLTSPSKPATAALTPSFTEIELSIANLIVDGIMSKEISEILGKSLKTVEYHRNNIRKKLGIKNTQISLQKALEEYFSQRSYIG